MDTQMIFNEMLTTMGHLPFPATKMDVINAARKSNARIEIQNAIASLPDHERFKSPQDVLMRLHLGTV